MMRKLNYRIAVLVAVATLLISGRPSNAQSIRTLNFDFGNSGAYGGAAGILSSPGGTHWNEVTITPSGGGVQFQIPPLLDEFGQAFGLGVEPRIPFAPTPSLYTASPLQGEATTALGTGPLNDGVRLGPTNFFGLTIRELSPDTPVDLVVYFNNPNPAQLETSTIQINSIFGGGAPVSATPSPFGAFPGVEGINYLRFPNLTTGPTTLGVPDLPGIIIQVPLNSVANIAAIQIRGEFVFLVPEPASVAMGLAASCFVCLSNRNRRPSTVAKLN